MSGIIIEIGAETAGAIKGIAGVQQALKSNLSGAEKFSAGVKGAFLPAVGVLGGLGAAAFAASQKAADLAETQSKVGVIFGDSAGKLDAWAKAAPTALGQTQQAALDAASQFATMGQAAGLSGDDLVSFSTQLTTLGSDLASFNNTSPEEAVAALGAALRGESEPLRKYGVMLNDATLKAEATKLGIYDGNGALTDQQKILAAQSAIMAKTKNAQGDFARTADGAANKQRILTATMEQTTTELGNVFLPILQTVTNALAAFAGWVRDNQPLVLALAGVIGGLAAAIVAINIAMKIQAAVTAAMTIAQWALNSAFLANPLTWVVIAIVAFIAAIVLLWNNCETFRNIVIGVWEAVKNAIGVVVNWFKETIWPKLKFVIDLIAAYYRGLFRIVKWAWDRIYSAIEFVVNWFKENVWPTLSAVIDWISDYFQRLWDGITIIWGGIRTAIQIVADWFKNTLLPLIQGPIDTLKALFQALWDTISSVFENIKNKITDVWGIVSGPIEKIGNFIGNAVGGAWNWFTGGDTGGGDSTTQTTRARSLTVNGGAAASNSPQVTVNVNTGIGDPVAIARQIRQTLRADFLKTGTA